MRSYLVMFLGASLLFCSVASAPNAQAAAMLNAQQVANKLRGYLLVSVQSNGLWYVSPTTGKRVYLKDGATAWKYVSSNATGITNADLKLIPEALGPEQAKTSETAERLKGQFVIAVQSHGEIWYVSPVTGRRTLIAGPEKAFETLSSLALGVQQTDLEVIPADESQPDPIVAVERLVVNRKPLVRKTNQNINTVTEDYTNAQLGWDFASSMWRGYEQYSQSHNSDWPEIKWFDNITSYNQPIYLSENGFQLEQGKDTYFVWKDFSPQWKSMYKQGFSMKRVGNANVMMIRLPKAVQTKEFGPLKAGKYYFTTDRGFLNETDYNSTPKNGPISMLPNSLVSTDAKIKDTKRVMDEVKAIQKALEQYRNDVKGYPVTYEHAMELGANGVTNLTRYNGFTGNPAPSDVVYMKDIATGAPSTRIMYDSRFDGSSYVITVTIYGSYDELEPGVYEISPYYRYKVANL